MTVPKMLLAGLFMCLYVCSVTAEASDSVRLLLKDAINASRDDRNEIFSGYVQSGYPHLPEYVWRVSFGRKGDFEWSYYFKPTNKVNSGQLLEKQISYYEGGDVRFVFWLNEKNELLRYQKKEPNTSLIHETERGLELRINVITTFDSNGNIKDIRENILLIDDNSKDAKFSSFNINHEGDLENRRSGDFDYYQLVR